MRIKISWWWGCRGETMIDDYLKVQTGQNMIDLGIVPKNSSDHIALIALKRLETLRDRSLETITDEMLGYWQPAIVQREMNVPVIIDPQQITRYAQVGMRVEGIGVYDGQDLRGMQGTIKALTPEGLSLGVEWDGRLGRGHDLGGRANYGYGYTVSANVVKLLVPEGKGAISYELAPTVVADKRTGHTVRFAQEYKFQYQKDQWTNMEITIPKSTQGTLVAFDQGMGKVAVHFESPLKSNSGSEHQELPLPLDKMRDILEASSLGQGVPAEKDEEVRKEVYAKFFPTTVLNTETAEQIAVGLLMGKDMIFYGPPGAGKSNTAKDIVRIAQQMNVIFTVEDCQVQCNPFSLFEQNFAKVVDACPECKMRYDPEFLKTGRFTRPHPKDVKVVVASFGEGHGVEMPEGTSGMMRFHMAGYKLPSLDANGKERKQNDYDPEGYHAGMLTRTNNGVLVLDELELMRKDTRDGLREALNSNRIRPDQLRYSFPAHALVMGTANDPSVFEDPLIDRMLLFFVGYPDDVDTSHGVTAKGYHGQVAEADDVPIGDTHRTQGAGVYSVPVPAIMERAVEAFYLQFRREYNGEGKTKIMGSTRCKFDALNAARAKVIVDNIFYKDVPSVAQPEDVVYGLQYALHGRVQQENPVRDREVKQALSAWVSDKLPEMLRQEEDVWWCRAYKDVAIKATKIPEIEGNFQRELAEYEEALSKVRYDVLQQAFASIKKAYDNPDDRRHALARVTSPFMDYLFKHQPRMEHCSEPQLVDLMRYYMTAREHSSCKV